MRELNDREMQSAAGGFGTLSWSGPESLPEITLPDYIALLGMAEPEQLPRAVSPEIEGTSLAASACDQLGSSAAAGDGPNPSGRIWDHPQALCGSDTHQIFSWVNEEDLTPARTARDNSSIASQNRPFTPATSSFRSRFLNR